jgi:hypothetical protein
MAGNSTPNNFYVRSLVIYRAVVAESELRATRAASAAVGTVRSLRIGDAIGQLANTTPPGQLH